MNIGIIAGYGNIVDLIWKEMERKGFDPLIIDIVGREYPKDVKKVALKSINIKSLLALLTNYHIDTLALVGKVDKRKILKDLNSYIKDNYSYIEKGDLNLLIELEKLLKLHGIHILDLKDYISPYITEDKLYVNGNLSEEEWNNIYFGAERAKILSDLEIGQTVIVKDMIVYAVEAIEGTDKCIERAAILGGREGIIVKVGRTTQQFSLEIPGVGIDTIKSAINSNMKILAIEAKKTLFLDQEECMELAKKNDLKIVGFSLETKI